MKENIDRLRVLLTAPVLLIILLAPLAAGQDDLETTLDRVREAVGYDALMKWKNGLVLEGRGQALGLDCQYTFLLLPDGRFRKETHSDLGGIEGYDGHCGWKVDSTGMPGHLELKDLETSLLQAWIVGGFWLDRSCPLRMELVPDGEEEDIRIAMSFPDGTVEAKLFVSRKTGLPQRLEWKGLDARNRIDLDQYDESAGFRLPRQIRIKESEETATFQVLRVKEAPDNAGKACSPITTRPDDTEFDHGKPAELEIKAVPTGHFLVKPLVDGKEAGWFFLDLGAGRSAIDSALAVRLGMKEVGTITATGGGGSVEAHFCRGKSVELGPLTMRDPMFISIELASIGQYLGCEIGGALGYDFLSRCLVELDIKKKKLLIHETGAWASREAPWQEIYFDGNIPAVRCTLEGDRKGIFHLDTGSSGTVQFHSPFVKKHGLLDDRDVKKGKIGGVGGFITSYSGRIDWFELGGHRFSRPEATFTTAEKGVFADRSTAGNIGNGFLSRFRLLIDYPGKRIAFVDNEVKR